MAHLYTKLYNNISLLIGVSIKWPFAASWINSIADLETKNSMKYYVLSTCKQIKWQNYTLENIFNETLWDLKVFISKS